MERKEKVKKELLRDLITLEFFIERLEKEGKDFYINIIDKCIDYIINNGGRNE